MTESTEIKKSRKPEKRNPWAWVPSLYFAEGIPYVIVMILSVAMYKRLGISNADIALYTSWLYLPWVIKPLWSPIVDILKTKRFWIVIMQLVVGAGFAGIALTIPVPNFFQWTLVFFWLLAFSSATHDIAADGFYMLGLSESDQAFFIGIRSTFYRFAMMTGQGLLIILAGFFEISTGLEPADMTVETKPGTEKILNFDPATIQISGKDGDLNLISHLAMETVGTENIKKEEAKAFVAKVKEWNKQNGFYVEEAAANKAVEADSWWTESISKPFAGWLNAHFGPKQEIVKQTNNVGNLNLIYFHLSKKPEADEEIVVNVAHKKGNKSIDLYKEGGKNILDRFVFNESNWNKPAFTVVQLDPKLQSSTSAMFRATTGNIPLAWSLTFFILAIMFGVFFIYHRFILPYPKSDVPATKSEDKGVLAEFFETFILFFKKKNMLIAVLFLLVYRLGESQLVKLAVPFLLDPRDVGGLGLTTGEVGLVYGTIGIIGLTLGGILGGVVASRHGLKYWLWWMFLCINLPHATYIYLSYALPDNFFLISLAVAVEQFGYGFGFTAYMLYMIYISQGKHKTAHFAIATGFMALGMMLPGMWSGWLQEAIGYQHFFVWVLLCIFPSALVVMLVKVDKNFGKKTKGDNEPAPAGH